MTKLNKGKTLEIDGKEYEFVLNLNALINFEEKTGRSLMDIDEDDKFGLADIRGLLWAGLNVNYDMSIDDVGKLINIKNISEISNKIMEVYEDSMPEGDDKEVKNKNRSAG